MIIEIGFRPYVALAFPDESAFFSTGETPPRPEVRLIRSMAELWGMLGAADTELIVCHPNFVSPWTPRHINRNIVSRRFIEGRSPLLRAIAPELLRRRRGRAKLIVLDHEDLPVINRDNLFLLERCDLWFKRELPADHWRVFTKTAHPHLPTPRFRERARNVRWVEKLRPLSIGLPLGAGDLLPLAPAEKRFDLFFSGRVAGSSTLRARGLGELKALEGQGVTLDIPDTPLPRAEFYQRCAAAHLVWSPEGLGWDCFRHYEAPACGSVPLINQPWLDRHAPLIAGEHALYYDVEPGGLTRAVKAALADKPALARMARAAQAHVMGHHTPQALAEYVVREARALG